jgi:hypothetical protein
MKQPLHLHVEQHQGDRLAVLLKQRHPGTATGRQPDVEAVRAEGQSQHLEQGRLVLHHQDARL